MKEALEMEQLFEKIRAIAANTHGPRPPIHMALTTYTHATHGLFQPPVHTHMTKYVQAHGPTYRQHVHIAPMAPNDAPLQGGHQMSKKTTYTHATHGLFGPPVHLYMTKHIHAHGHTYGQQCMHETNGPKMMLKAKKPKMAKTPVKTHGLHMAISDHPCIFRPPFHIHLGSPCIGAHIKTTYTHGPDHLYTWP
jgi:hypothetical protein